MRRLLIVCFSLLSLIQTNAQTNAVWSIEFNALDSSVRINSKISKGWHIYSQHIDPYAGPVPTSFSFSTTDGVKLVGPVEEPEAIVHFDEAFGADLMYFENEVNFKQKIILSSQANLNVVVSYMMCNDTMCLPPTDQKLTIELIP
jgi:thiol:disulfide interchange protein DsbD